jgi:hypothetical protein
MLPARYRTAAMNALRTTAQWAHEQGYHLRCAVGHSLGGAIAQCPAEIGGADRVPRIPAASINGPCMGTIQGMRLQNSAGILTLNSAYDPLSQITGMAGNKSHAEIEIVIKTAISKVPMPLDAEAYGLEYDPKSSLLTNKLRGSQKDVFFAADFRHWFATKLAPALGAGHSVEVMRRSLRGSTYASIGESKLSAYFPQVGR